MKCIAVIGVGIMGSGIAANYLEAGYKVVVWNRTPQHAQPLIDQGAVLADTPKDAVNEADIVFEVTANDESSRSVWLGKSGILTGAASDKVLITSATLTVGWTEELARLCAEKDFTFFDMPLTGGRVAAEGGSLTLLVGGDQKKLEQITPYLEAISSKIYYFGEVGNGMKYKLVLNSLQSAHLAAFGEAMHLAEKAGLDPAKVGPALVDRPGGILTQIAWEAYRKDEPPLTFSVDWISKDLDYAKQIADDLELPIIQGVAKKYKKAQSDGLGGEDWTIINK